MTHGHIYIIGPAKTATTWLYQVLTENEDFWCPATKEFEYWKDPVNREVNFLIHAKKLLGLLLNDHLFHLQCMALLFYSRRLIQQRGCETYLWCWNSLLGRRTPSHYTNLYNRHFQRGKITIDVSPAYFFWASEDNIRLMCENPLCGKVITLQRDPVSWVWSNFKYFFMKNSKNITPEHPGLKEILNLWLPNIVPRLRVWRKIFGAERLYVSFFDRVAIEPRDLFSEIRKFCGLPGDFPDSPTIEKKVYVSKEGVMPEEVRDLLLTRCRPVVEEMCSEFPDSYPEKWLKFWWG